MSLAALLRILGVRELSRRLGLKPSTIERWLRAGAPSKRGQEALNAVAERRRRSLKARETHQQRVAFRERLVMPEHPSAASSLYPFATGYLTPDQVLPPKRPIETAEQLARVRKRAGQDGGGRVDTDRFVGESVWLPIGQPILDVDLDQLTDDVVSIWQRSGRTWVHILVMLFRYIPFNPFYTGEMIRKQGKWVDFWVQSSLCATLNAITVAVKTILANAFRAAETRLIWLEAVKVRTFDSKDTLPSYARTAGRQLRAT